MKIVERQNSQENTADYHEVLQTFEEYGKNKDPDQVFSEEYIKTVIGAILLIIVAAVVILLIVRVCCARILVNSKYFDVYYHDLLFIGYFILAILHWRYS